MRVDESGDVVLPGRLLLDIVRALPAAGVTIAQPEALVPGCSSAAPARRTRRAIWTLPPSASLGAPSASDEEIRGATKANG